MPSYHRLSALDALFLDLEGPTTHMHVGGVLLFSGTPPPYEDLLEYVRRRLSLVPRYRQRLMYPPIPQARPLWIDDPHFNIEYHVRQSALPQPGDIKQLQRLVGRIMSQQLDRSKPLWEMWLIEGLQGGRFSLVFKTHHCMVDGVSGVDLGSVMMDWSETPAEVPDDGWTPAAPPSGVELMAEIARESLAGASQLWQRARAAAEAPEALVQKVAEGAGALAGLIGMGFSPKSTLNVDIGPHRRFEPVPIALEQIKTIRRSLGGTVNDVVLAGVTGALRRLLEQRGEILQGKTLRAMIPVSVRAPEARGALGNQVTAMFAPLPVGEPEPSRRLDQLRATMNTLKESGQAVGARLLTKLSDYTPPTIVAQAARLQAQTRAFNLVITNVPGPQVPLYLMGRQLEAAFPVVPLAERQSLCVGVLSYHGTLGFGLVGDYDAMRDLSSFADALRASFDELERTAEKSAAATAQEATLRS